MSQRNDDGGRISWSRRLLLFAFAAAAIVGSVFASQEVWRENGLRSLQAVNEQRVQLFANALRSEINRQDHLPVFLSLDTDVQNALSNPGDIVKWQDLNQKLARLSLEADTSALYVLDLSGIVKASSAWEKSGGLIGRNLSDQQSFKVALATGRSTYLGVEPGSRSARYYISESVRAARPLGVAMVRIEFDQLENNWELAGERVFVTDKSGVVFLSSDPIYKFRILNPSGTIRGAQTSLQGADADDPIGFEVIEKRSAGSIIKMSSESDGGRFLYQSMTLLEYGWTIHRLTGLESIDADQRDGGIIGGALSAHDHCVVVVLAAAAPRLCL